jgi:1-acyl-sn-glycerol-3-phosphate acyltransferase
VTPPRLVRRLLLPVLIGLEVAGAVILAAVAVLGLIGVPFDQRARLTRLAVFGISYISIELAALIRLFGLWLVRPFHDQQWWRRANTNAASWALGRVLGAARRTVHFVIETREPEDTSLLSGHQPVVVLARHGGIGDSFTLAWLLADRYGRVPRIVLKGVLQWEPFIDVALTRLDACFLPSRSRRRKRSSEEHSPDESVGVMAAGLRDGEALLLFPEGANWTPRRRMKAIASLWRSGQFESVRAASAMEAVLPPRSRGVLACLDRRPDLPIVVFAHAGLDRLSTATLLWKALPFEVPMTLRWWPAGAAPTADDDRVRWLNTEWAVLDAWVAGQHDDRLSGRQRDGSENFWKRHHSSES